MFLWIKRIIIGALVLFQRRGCGQKGNEWRKEEVWEVGVRVSRGKVQKWHHKGEEMLCFSLECETFAENRACKCAVFVCLWKGVKEAVWKAEGSQTMAGMWKRKRRLQVTARTWRFWDSVRQLWREERPDCGNIHIFHISTEPVYHHHTHAFPTWLRLL